MSKYQDLLFGGGPGGSTVKSSPEPTGSTPGSESRYQDLAFGSRTARLPDAEPTAGPEKPWLERTAQGFIDTALPFSDEIEAGMRAGYGKLDTMLGGYLPGEPETYEDALADVQSRREGAAYYAGMPLGLVAPGGIAATAGQTAARLGAGRAAQYGTTAAASAAEGALFAAGDADPGERMEAVPTGAAIGALAGVAGQRLGESLTSRLERRLAEDIDRLDVEEVARLRGKAADQGITLTPAELSDLPSLKAQQRVVGQNAVVGDDLDAFMTSRNADQIDPAIERFFGKISDVEGDEAAGELVRGAATRASESVASNRASQASPLYQRAFEEAAPVDVAPVLAKIDEIGRTAPDGGEVSRSLSKARRLIGENTDLPTLHGVKLELDQMIEGSNLAKKLGRTTQAKVLDVQKELVGQLDKASPDYQEARAIFADLSPGVQRVREGVVGTIADLPDQQLRTAANRLFAKSRISERAASEAKEQLKAADPDAWQAIKRAFLEETWLKASKDLVDGDAPNRGAKFRQALLGDKKQAKILKATLEPDEFQALTDLGDVLEATGRVKRMGSDTAQNLEQIRRDRDNATPFLAKFLRGINPTELLKMASDKLVDRRLLGDSKRIVQIITSPDGITMMKELKRASPGERLEKAIIGQWIAQAGGRSVANGMGQSQRVVAEDDQAPAPALSFTFERDEAGNIVGAKPGGR